MLYLPRLDLGRAVNRVANILIGAAAADVAAHDFVDIGVGRLVIFREKRRRGMICPDWQ